MMNHNIQLSPSQEKAVLEFQSFIQDDSQSELVISGFAGSGKTFLIQYLRDVARAHLAVTLTLDKKGGWNTYYTATTNKAARVLRDVLHEETGTIHSLLGLKVKNDRNTGKTYLEETRHTKPLGKALVFVDEASMVNKELLAWIRELSVPGRTKVIYIGDKYQLAPVKDKYSPVFHRPENIVELIEIQRQVQGNPIIETAHIYRKLLDSELPDEWPEIKSQGAEVVQVDDGREFQDCIDRAYTQKHEPNDLKVIAWTNERVVQYNKYIRSLLTPHKEFIPGERVITNNPIMSGSRVYRPADSIVTITEIRPGHYKGFDGYAVEINYEIGGFVPNDWKAVQKRMSYLYRQGDYEAHFDFKESFLDLRALHACTAHKSQGSTYKEVFIDVEDIGFNKKWEEQCRLLYVAISRASEKVYLYGRQTMMNWKR